MRHAHFISSVVLVAATVLSGCRGDNQVAQNGTNSNTTSRASGLTVPSGTSIDVTLASLITSETASVGDGWTGSIRNAPALDGRNAIPVGSSVAGTVSSVKPARKGDRAMLDLRLTSITVGEHRYTVGGSMEAVVAGSTRARNLGAIAASAAAGALIGKAVSGRNKGAVIGGVVGGGVATGVVASSDGYQVVLKAGTPLTFTTNESVAMRP